MPAVALEAAAPLDPRRARPALPMLSAMVEPREDDASFPETAPRSNSKRNVIIIVVVVAAAALFVTRILPLLIVLTPKSQTLAQRLEDTNDLRIIAGLLIIAEEVPLAPDGRIDVYAVLREEFSANTKEIVDICTSSRTGKGPTVKEIEAGDYRNFPYQRYKGARDRKSYVRVPVVWDRAPYDYRPPRGKGGPERGRLVAFSDGSATFEEEATFRKFLDANPGQE